MALVIQTGTAPGETRGTVHSPIIAAMADALHWLGVDLDDADCCATTLLRTGYPARIVGEHLDAVITIAAAKRR